MCNLYIGRLRSRGRGRVHEVPARGPNDQRVAASVVLQIVGGDRVGELQMIGPWRRRRGGSGPRRRRSGHAALVVRRGVDVGAAERVGEHVSRSVDDAADKRGLAGEGGAAGRRPFAAAGRRAELRSLRII